MLLVHVYFEQVEVFLLQPFVDPVTFVKQDFDLFQPPSATGSTAKTAPRSIRLAAEEQPALWVAPVTLSYITVLHKTSSCQKLESPTPTLKNLE